ncbi:MAG TPA: TIGR03435 family protein [Acidobacteriaceae bacterium]|nr:TIGR03435 family protein [Acidobacteriaceae bacterium]
MASFRVSDDPVHVFARSDPGASEFIVRNASLSTLMILAFGDVRVIGQPKWFFSTAYTIRAKAEGERGLSYEELRLPLQHLLDERLHLRYHSETDEVPGYGLVIGKGGPKLQESKGGSYQLGFTQGAQNGFMVAKNATMQDIASMLGRPLGYRPTVDETGLKGKYDFRLSYASPESTDSSLPSLLTVLRESLGLQFVKEKVQQTTIVIEHVDQVPTEN